MTLKDVMTKEEVKALTERMAEGKARDIIMLTKILISELGKEKTIALMKKARWEIYSKRGKQAAEKMGHPEDLGSFAEAYWGEEMKSVKWKEASKFEEKTQNRIVINSTTTCPGKALAKVADKELWNVFREGYCIHDIAWTNGFNPKIKVKITNIFFDGDDHCRIVWEL
jgi:hypothetical protein